MVPLYLQMILLSGIFGAVLEYLRRFLLEQIDTTTDMGSLLMIVIIGTVFVITLYSSGRLLGIREIDDLSRRLVKKISR